MATHLTTDDAGRSWWTMAGAVVVVLAMTVLAGRSLWLTGNPVPLYASAAFVTGVAFGRGVERWRRMGGESTAGVRAAVWGRGAR